MKLKIGNPAPTFELQDQTGRTHKLPDYKGEWVVLYFYPKDDTPGCTKEACSFRDNLPKFKAVNAVILGVSVDSVAKHEKFVEKYDLNFPLLSDENKKVVQDYDVWQEKNMMGKKYMGIVRTTFIIDPKGKIAEIFEKVKADKHGEEVVRELKNLQD